VDEATSRGKEKQEEEDDDDDEDEQEEAPQANTALGSDGSKTFLRPHAVAGRSRPGVNWVGPGQGGDEQCGGEVGSLPSGNLRGGGGEGIEGEEGEEIWESRSECEQVGERGQRKVEDGDIVCDPPPPMQTFAQRDGVDECMSWLKRAGILQHCFVPLPSLPSCSFNAGGATMLSASRKRLARLAAQDSDLSRRLNDLLFSVSYSEPALDWSHDLDYTLRHVVLSRLPSGTDLAKPPREAFFTLSQSSKSWPIVRVVFVI